VELAEAGSRRPVEEREQVWDRLGELRDMPRLAAEPDAAAA
jgi:hypothetical protein